jgi:hypothetical protein
VIAYAQISEAICFARNAWRDFSPMSAQFAALHVFEKIPAVSSNPFALSGQASRGCCSQGQQRRTHMKLVYKLAMIGAVFASGVTAASAHTRNWNSGSMTEPFYGGHASEDIYGTPVMGGYNNYGVSRPYISATPQNDNYNSGGN